MNKPTNFLLGVCLCLLLAGCRREPDAAPGAGAPGHAAQGSLRVGYVLHGLNQFTEVIQQGAREAGTATGIAVEVVGPASFSTTSEAIALFEGLSLKKVNGLVVIPMPGEVWVTPIRQASEAGIPVLTANVTSLGSAARAWFGQDEYNSGVILANELKKLLAEQGQTEGRIVVGMCAPGISVLVDRYEGFKRGMEGTRFQITAPFDVTPDNNSNYGAWENLVGANPNMIAAVGLCSLDLPNLGRLKQRTQGRWLAAGYDLNRETLDALKAGTVQVALGQHPYLQGYLPILALARHLREQQPLPQGWIDVGTEIVTRQNVDTVYQREVNGRTQTEWYAAYLAKHFTNFAAVAKPMPGPRK